MGQSVTSAVPHPLALANPLTLAQIYTSHVQRVSRWAWRLGGPREDLPDVVQDVFEVAARRWSGFDGNHLDTWLFRITENVVRARRRKGRWRKWLGLSEDDDDAEHPGLGPAALLEQQQTHALVYRALELVKEKHRSMVILFELEGLSGQEISQLTGTPIATVWVWLHRGRREFQARFSELSKGEHR